MAGAGEVCERIVRLHAELSRRDGLAPAPDVDALFGELVRVCVHADDVNTTSVLADARVRELAPDLLRLCSDGEALLERAAGSSICFLGGGPLPVSALVLHRRLGARVDVVDSTGGASGVSWCTAARAIGPAPMA